MSNSSFVTKILKEVTKRYKNTNQSSQNNSIASIKNLIESTTDVDAEITATIDHVVDDPTGNLLHLIDTLLTTVTPEDENSAEWRITIFKHILTLLIDDKISTDQFSNISQLIFADVCTLKNSNVFKFNQLI